MAKTKPQFDKYKMVLTPKGRAVFAYLTKPDTEFNEDGVYRTKLALEEDDEATQEFLERLEEIQEEAIEAVKAAYPKKKKIKTGDLFTYEEDDEEERTGAILFNFKTNAKRKVNGKLIDDPLDIVDAKKNPHPKSKPVYSGSVIRIAAKPVPNYVQGTLYISLYIVAVQVISLETSGGATSMFDEEEGYEADEDDDDVPFDEEDEHEDDEEDEDEDDLY